MCDSCHLRFDYANGTRSGEKISIALSGRNGIHLFGKDNPRWHDFGQQCERCFSKNVARGGFNKRGNQLFRCSVCGLGWTINKSRGIDHGQICPNCNSRHVVKYGGIQDGRQGFLCKNKSCKKQWRVPSFS
jgi:transposase-like protein